MTSSLRIVAALLCALLFNSVSAQIGAVQAEYSTGLLNRPSTFLTNATNALTMVTAGLPSQTGNGGKVLGTNGSSLAWQVAGGGGGSGTVTSVAVANANGVSATGGPITTSGSFTFSLGAITPSTVNGLTFTSGSATAAAATDMVLNGGTTGQVFTVAKGGGTASTTGAAAIYADYDGYGGITSQTGNSWAGGGTIPRLRISAPSGLPTRPDVPANFLMLPYEYGMALDYTGGTLETWVREFSVKGSVLNEDGSFAFAAPLSWVGDNDDTGGIRMTARSATHGGGELWSEVASSTFLDGTHGPLRLRVVTTNDQFEWHVGTSTVHSMIGALTGAGNLLLGGSVDITGNGGAKLFGTTDATGVNSGSFINLGGGSFSKALYVGGVVHALSDVAITGTASVAGEITSSNATAATSTSTGALIINNHFSVGGLNGNVFLDGTLNVAGSAANLTAASASIKMGAVGVGGTPFVDFISAATSNVSTDYNARIIASVGNATTGSGDLRIRSATFTVDGHTVFEGVTSTGATGTGKLVYDGSPTLTTAVLGSSTATTQSAGDNSTKVSTTAYADNAGLASHLGTFASPNTAAGAITWTSPVYNIYTSAASTRTYTLPAASTYVNRAFILNVAVGTGHVNVQPASGAALVLAGTLLTANHYVQAATSAPGNYICFISDGTNWTSLGSSGTWADAASP